MKLAIRKYWRDFLAIIGLALIAIGIGAYIISQQDARPRIPLVEGAPFKLKAEFSDAQAVTPGQGQTVRVAGVEVGKIGKVELEEGKAIVGLDMDPKYKGLLRRDATALLRPRTGLKDMFVEIDPGSKSQPAMRENERIPLSNTAPDIDPDEILSALDTDTRDYLQLLVNGAGKGLKDHGDDLNQVFKRFEPLHRDLARLNGAIAERRRNLRTLIHNYGSLTTELARNDDDLKTLVSASNSALGAFAAEDENISEAVRRLPSTLDTTADTLGKVEELGRVLGPSLESLRPAFRQLDEANREILPFVREAEPITRTQIRPFVRAARGPVRNLRRAAVPLARATPDLVTSFLEFNRLFNMAAYNRNGREGLSGNLAQDRQRDEGYLFWLAWAINNSNSVFSTSDAQGPFRRASFIISCATLQEILRESGPVAELVFGNSGLLSNGGFCSRPGP